MIHIPAVPLELFKCVLFEQLELIQLLNNDVSDLKKVIKLNAKDGKDPEGKELPRYELRKSLRSIHKSVPLGDNCFDTALTSIDAVTVNEGGVFLLATVKTIKDEYGDSKPAHFNEDDEELKKQLRDEKLLNNEDFLDPLPKRFTSKIAMHMSISDLGKILVAAKNSRMISASVSLEPDIPVGTKRKSDALVWKLERKTKKIKINDDPEDDGMDWL